MLENKLRGRAVEPQIRGSGNGPQDPTPKHLLIRASKYRYQQVSVRRMTVAYSHMLEKGTEGHLTISREVCRTIISF